MTLAQIEHRLDREHHALFESESGAGCAVVKDLRVFMKVLAYAVAAELLNNRESMGLSMTLDRVTDITKGCAGFDLKNPEIHGFLADFCQTACPDWNLAYQKHLAGVAMVTVLDDGDIDIDDVATLQLLGSGNAVTDSMVDGSANGFWEAPVVQWSGDCLLNVDDVIVTDSIQFLGGNPCDDIRLDHFKDFSRQAAGYPHGFDFFGSFDSDGHRGLPDGPQRASQGRDLGGWIVETSRSWYKGLLF